MKIPWWRLCWHDWAVIGLGGFFTVRISKCSKCLAGKREVDYSSALMRWFCSEVISPEQMSKYEEKHINKGNL